MNEPTQNVKVRPLQIEDLKEARRINDFWFKGTTVRFGFCGRLRFFCQYVLASLGLRLDFLWVVAELENQIVGFAVYEVCRKEIHIARFGVDPEKLRMGIGTKMMQWLIKESASRNKRIVVLEARETAFPALCFYKSMGFKTAKIIHRFYSDTNEGAHFMKLTL